MEFGNILYCSFWYSLEFNPHHLKIISEVLTEDIVVLKKKIEGNNLILTIKNVTPLQSYMLL